ncbi:glycogen synthase [Thiohalorhabdus denitrificans]|uniref:Glycogen synthase n=1 Tax=Thiohalorhabdus denitrificans TaxID=381306 RepID=A0A0P9C505_9GAMM|nr:glycogen synthase GlgA [Thiohalorhabdus denitrificans]KPV40071.1 glycogen synthase [Thiohalorhabdus denitrificans]SCY14546.1 starch synthase [Thiohalorhabdus denitrificans]
MLRILFVTSEVHPFVKTGGLADVSASLPHALHELGHDVRVLVPGYADALRRAGNLPVVEAWRGLPGGPKARLRAARLPDSGVPVWMLDTPGFSDRPGNPYLAPDGEPHPDNADRFHRLARAAAGIAGDRAGLDWRPDVVHCNDWQTGLVPVRMLLERIPAAAVFTIHNLAYQGLFPHATFQGLGLPPWLWHPEALEFHGHLSFMKGGAVFADRLTTVSPSYAREIHTAEHGWGLQGLFRQRAADLTGILNGIDHRAWDPTTDPYLPAHFSGEDLAGKRDVKAALQGELGLEADPEAPLLGVVSRLADQKGIDLLLGAARGILARGAQLAVVGTGDRYYETALRRLAEYNPGKVGIHLGFSEALAHRVEAGADLLLMPSRFEPCGLNQLYALRYGTVPVVRAVGGLADSVVDATSDALAAGRATGIAFSGDTAAALTAAVDRALKLYRDGPRWRRMQAAGMEQDFTWERSAAEYVEVYRTALEAPVPT